MKKKNEIKDFSVTAGMFSWYDLDEKSFPSTDFKTVTDACVLLSAKGDIQPGMECLSFQLSRLHAGEFCQ